MRVLARSTFAAIAVASIAALGGCSALQGLIGAAEPVARDAETQEVVEGGQADVFTLKVGDCFDDVTEDEVYEVPAVPCGDPHDNEIYYEFTMPDGEYPGDDVITAAADAECRPQFEAFVGMAYAESVLDWFPFTPTEGSWSNGDRVVQCAVYEPGARVSGSLAGVAR